MKYRVHTHHEGFDVITEDGGLVAFYDFEGDYHSDYYQERLTSVKEGDYVWDVMSNSKTYYRDWNERPTDEQVIADALDWLVFPQPASWERDDSLFTHILPIQ